jgi:ATP-dependent protease ClpP protease subunit
MWALHQSDDKWYRIRNQTDGPTQLFIYDEIGYFGVGASDLVKDLADVTGPVEVHINSPGGEVWEGITIYNTLMSRGDVTVVIDGLAASIASVIACAGKPTLIAQTGQMVIHDGFTMALGNAGDLRKLADKLDRASDTIAGVYAARTGGTAESWREKMKVETTFSGQEAIDAGLVNGFVSKGHAPHGMPEHQPWDLDNLFSAATLVNAASVPYVGHDQHRHIPVTTRHSHDHSAFGASDHDDGVHNHVHEHHNDANHEHDHTGNEDGDHDHDDNLYGKVGDKIEGKVETPDIKEGDVPTDNLWDITEEEIAGIIKALKGA